MMSIIDVALERISDCCCSQHELRLYLEKEFASLPNLESSLDSAFHRLEELELINDFRLATNLAQRYAHKGDRFISQILRQKGVAQETIDKVLSTLDNEDIRALDEARKKLASLWDCSENTMNLLERFLSGRSFSGSVIKTVIGQLGEQKHCSVN